ncbi:sugar porter (SP) family MFS transporter [Mycetocola sp. BIGb0189]|uniref:sugar porter family MFS transporter n=1 Tax=Mycetocola sp. BIGb0189 TaxID=2940604 RepID=UPI00216A1927|nr:sugar porter family MFS transporter [Mycetocola sp. BIGb0189]MCS4275649.1 sugar porter (SP) family MFS transporter [Mycetocola sp. BIGb0189]
MQTTPGIRRRPTRLALLIGIAATTVGIIYGYDSSNIGGAMLYLATDFNLSLDQQQLVTTTVVVGEILGAIFGGYLSNRFGRKAVMVGVAATFALFSLASGLAPTLELLILARFLLGATIGVSVVVVPVFVAESAPARSRGAFLVMYQVATVIGIILGYLIVMALAPSENWRWMLGLAAIPGLVITFVLLKLPDTPRWYLLHGRLDEARRTLAGIEGDGGDVERELALIQDSMNTHKKGTWRDMLRRPFLRATLFIVGLGFFVQITGINAIVYYSPRIFEAMGFTDDVTKLGLSALVQAAGLAAVFLALAFIDRLGRRPVLLIGIGTMILANALLVTVFLVGNGTFTGALTTLGFIGLMLFTAGFSFGFGSLVWVYAGETMPTHLRSLGASTMLSANLVGNILVGSLFLTVLTQLGGSGAFLCFGILALAAFAFVLRFAPETKGRDLEEIGQFWAAGGRWEDTAGAADTVSQARHGAQR